MAKLTIEDDQARSIYPTASSELKTILENTFGKSFFSQKITDRIGSMDDVCKLAGWACHRDLQNTCTLNGDTPDEIGYKEAKMLAKVLNEGAVLDWNNSSQGKYMPYMDMRTSSFGLRSVLCYCTSSYVGSRLCFKSRELAQFAYKLSPSTYKALFIL